jgi:hypothetical protein
MPSKLNAISTGTPSLKFTAAGDGALEIQNDGNTAISIANTGIATFTTFPKTTTPNFLAYRSGTEQSVTTATSTKVQLNAVTHDIGGYFNTTNNRYTPLIAGYYQFNAAVYAVGTNLTQCQARIHINGSVNEIVGNYVVSAAQGTLIATSNYLSYMNGTTDYVELYTYIVGTSPRVAVTLMTHLSGFLVHRT